MTDAAYPLHPAHYSICRIPASVIAADGRHPLLRDLMVTRAGYFPKAQGHEVQRETFDEYLVIYCVDGAGWIRLGHRQWTVGKGDIVFLQPDMAHGYGAAPENPWSIHWAHFNGRHARHFLELADISSSRPMITVGERFNLVALFNQILTTLQLGYSLHFLISAAAGLHQVLSGVALQAVYAPPPPYKDLNVQRIIQFMAANVTRPYTLDELAAEANLSPSHFARTFKKKTGYAPIDYFIRLKIQKACELLETTDQQVGEIGHGLGYPDLYYFSRLFKKVVGLSPRQYRAERYR